MSDDELRSVYARIEYVVRSALCQGLAGRVGAVCLLLLNLSTVTLNCLPAFPPEDSIDQ